MPFADPANRNHNAEGVGRVVEGEQSVDNLFCAKSRGALSDSN